MKTLTLIRHAKSSWDDETLDDKARPLNERGLRDAPKLGERLAKRGVVADLILTSPAVRALTTAESVAEAIAYTRKHIVVDERIYESTPGTLLAIIQGLNNTHEHVMLFGHNPEFTDLARMFSPSITEMTTCSIAEFTFNVYDWAEIGTVEPSKVVFEMPKGAD